VDAQRAPRAFLKETAVSCSQDPAEAAAHQVVAAALSFALADPASPRAQRPDWLTDTLLHEAWNLLVSATGPLERPQLGVGERAPADTDPTPLRTWLALSAERQQQVHQAVFGLLISRECPPYETEYLPWNDPTHRAQSLADIAGFYAACGLELSRDHPERPDHVALELEFVAFAWQKITAMLIDGGATGDHQQTCQRMLHLFVRDHIAWWMPTFARCLERRIKAVARAREGQTRDDVSVLAGVARLLSAWVPCERRAYNVEPSRRLLSPQVPVGEQGEDSACCMVCGPGPAAID